jgi:Ca2+-binding RTX toxin-like protein
MYASQTAVSFDGQAGNDLLVGSKAGDTLIGGQGDDELQGGKGNDLYTHRAGDGFDTLLDTDATAGNTDTLSWEGVSADQLWLSRSGNDLQIQVLGSADGVRVSNWYLGSNNQVERITVGAQTLTNGRVQALVQQMSAFSPPAGGIGSLNAADQATLRTALNTAWQG